MTLNPSTSTFELSVKIEPHNAPLHQFNNNNNNNKETTNNYFSERKKRKYKINTKCGSIEFDIERILTFLVMFVVVASLLGLAIMSGFGFIRSYKELSVYYYGGKSTGYSIELSTYMRIVLSSDIIINDRWLLKINSTFENWLYASEWAIFHSFYVDYYEIQLPQIVKDIQKEYEHLYNSLLLQNINKTSQFQYFQNEFVKSVESFNVDYLLSAYRYSLAINERESSYIVITSIIGTIVCALILLIILPTGFIATFGRNNKLLEKLQKVNAKEVLKTINDPYLNDPFRKFCKENQKLNYFLFLEKSLLYSEYCEEIFNLNSIENYLNDSSTNSIETRIDEFESKKCEIIFEIKTEFLNSKGEYFLGEKQIGGKKEIQKVKLEFKSNPMNLSDNLLDEIESNISICLISTLKSFQSNLKNKKFISTKSLQ
ncbi:predicted protein [Naegleria gruberi]|uniref:Predicted protein n=1 Tax=Naegleria gruberi TaxID=5762 RepID=D2VC09_NAEGR|nr:uncharacterized protein NAEGRDRAFT_66405 [Naegleria gruberi]EFC45573.1 predicted protein [Naegleria gruberi]|eukprot:XP_002678317.1 predicted protein [Naegleria gruberi strain NEG-M]